MRFVPLRHAIANGALVDPDGMLRESLAEACAVTIAGTNGVISATEWAMRQLDLFEPDVEFSPGKVMPDHIVQRARWEAEIVGDPTLVDEVLAAADAELVDEIDERLGWIRENLDNRTP